MEQYRAVQVSTTTASREDAERIGAMLVEGRLAACVQVVGPVSSRYRWQGRVESSQEWMCLIKTTPDRFSEVEAAVAAAHGYEVPEIVALPIVAGSRAYLDWVVSEVGMPGNEAARGEGY